MMTKISLSFILIIFSFHLFAQDWNEAQKITSNDRNEEHFFGGAVAIDDNYAIVGARGNALDTNDSNPFESAGAAYIFEKNGNNEWIQIQKLIASDRGPDDAFGQSVSISNDFIIIGAGGNDEGTSGQNSLEGAGSVYFFEKNDQNVWEEVQKITASDRAVKDYFGTKTAIYGNQLVVGAPGQDLDAAGENLMNNAGAAYIFERNESTGIWTEVQKIVASNRKNLAAFGLAVAIQNNKAVIGAPNRSFGTEPDNFFIGVGLAYLFEKEGNWVEKKVLTPSEQGDYHYYGRSVAIDGDYIYVGSPGHDINVSQSGAVFVYKSFLDSFPFIDEIQLIEPNYQESHSFFGQSIAVSGGYAIFAAYSQNIHDGIDITNSGAVYIYQREDGEDTWNEIQTIVASDRAEGDYLGYSAAISNGYAIVGSTFNDTEADGQNFQTNAGAAYILDFEGGINDTKKVESVTFDFYPNPTTKQINIDLGEQQSITKLYLRDVDGRLLNSKQFQNSRLIQYDITSPAGIYFLEILVNENQSTTVKVVKSGK